MVYPQVFEHSLKPISPFITNLLTLLLPHSLILLRRLQFPHLSNSAVLLASFPPQERVLDGISPSPFSISLFDPEDAPDVAAHVFTSVDLPSPLSDSEHERDAIRAQLRAIFSYFHAVQPSPLPQYSPNPEDDASPTLAHIILVGNVNHATAQVLISFGDSRISRVSPGFQKFIISSSVVSTSAKYLQASTGESPSSDDELPEQLEWSRVDPFRPEEYGLVHSTNEYVRGPQRLALWPGVALRVKESGALAGWIYIGDSGGIRTLYVLPEWRRRGLAQKLVKKIVEEFVQDAKSTANADGGEIVHCDILETNGASTKLFEGMGWERVWNSYWIAVDLGGLPERLII